MTKVLLGYGVFLALLGIGCPTASAQTPGPWGSWLIGTVQLPGSSTQKWGGFAEAQARTDGVLRRYFYQELKGGVSYDLDRNFTGLLGGGRYATFADPGPRSVEQRLWLQLVLSQYMKRLRVEHRYRVEQRWFSYPNASSSTRNRLRYRLNAFLPLNKSTITTNTVFLSVYDEIFLNPRGPVLERNRVYAGVGYQFNSHFTVQVGWLNQANYSPAAIRNGQLQPQGTALKNNVVLAVVYRLARRAAPAGSELMPSQQD
ncbi:hypothetical protein GCM10022408_20240 [Hymenobacter fastidiosus]|uniref:DUF2490 domain-containing protein n=1 Tax=Hymenobacter fastidiosus TaxID=486264 RepID=A0ABP7S845_9BACT